MKTILVPTDFSDTSKCAFFYARKIAEALGGATIKLVHVFMPAVESEYPNFVPPVSEFLKIREDMLREFTEGACREHDPAPGVNVPVDRELLIGFPADEISRISPEHDLIIMGTTGAGNLLNKLFGSVSSAVARRARCPVILIPRDMAFHGFNHILYASNYESADEQMLERVLEFNRPFGACIHFVHVRGADSDAFAKTKEEIFDELFRGGEPGFSFQMADVAGESVAEALSSYAEKHDIDLIVMVSPKRSFWENFFHRSQTKRMALTTRIPLMVLHMQEEAVAK